MHNTCRLFGRSFQRSLKKSVFLRIIEIQDCEEPQVSSSVSDSCSLFLPGFTKECSATSAPWYFYSRDVPNHKICFFFWKRIFKWQFKSIMFLGGNFHLNLFFNTTSISVTLYFTQTPDECERRVWVETRNTFCPYAS